jgi:diphosphomevalonate decarboxylase
MTTRAAIAIAQPNLALIKYFGKREGDVNLPATPSLGLTVDGLRSRVRVEASIQEGPDSLTLQGASASEAALTRARRVWDEIRTMTGRPWRFSAQGENDFPTASGLASSASGLAALARASAAAACLEVTPEGLAPLARIGSGSAARSCLGGWVTLDTEGRAAALPSPSLDLSIITVVVQSEAKAVGSTEAMNRARDTSPDYPAWLETGRAHFDAARAALLRGDYATLFETIEANWRAMHTLLASCAPPIRYLTAKSEAAIDAIQDTARALGAPLAVTFDAGANPFVVCRREDAREAWRTIKARLPEASISVHGSGLGARLESRG